MPKKYRKEHPSLQKSEVLHKKLKSSHLWGPAEKGVDAHWRLVWHDLCDMTLVHMAIPLFFFVLGGGAVLQGFNSKRTIKVSSLARSVPKPLKVPSLARKKQRDSRVHQRHVTQAFSARRPLFSWSSTLGVARRGSTLQKLSSAARYEVRLPKVNCR